jgi:hypothetical protein
MSSGEYLDGVCASGLWEARLAREFYKGELTTYSPAYTAKDLPEILRLSDHVIFNNPAQIARFADLIAKARAEGQVFEIGLRLNPEHSEGEVAKYDPAQPCSRLGFPVSQLTAENLIGVDGLHIHALCEQDFQPLSRIWAAVEPKLSPLLGGIKWLNLGGGHHITRADYQTDDLIAFVRDLQARHGVQVYLEPGEAVALDAGILIGEVLDVFHNGMPVAITDISATCHMPDVIEAPYRPAHAERARTCGVTYAAGRAVVPGRRHHRRLWLRHCADAGDAHRLPGPGPLFDGEDQHLQRGAAAGHRPVEQRHRRADDWCANSTIPSSATACPDIENLDKFSRICRGFLQVQTPRIQPSSCSTWAISSGVASLGGPKALARSPASSICARASAVDRTWA